MRCVATPTRTPPLLQVNSSVFRPRTALSVGVRGFPAFLLTWLQCWKAGAIAHAGMATWCCHDVARRGAARGRCSWRWRCASDGLGGAGCFRGAAHAAILPVLRRRCSEPPCGRPVGWFGSLLRVDARHCGHRLYPVQRGVPRAYVLRSRGCACNRYVGARVVDGAAHVVAARVGARAACRDLVGHWVGNLEAAAVALHVGDYDGYVILGVTRLITVRWPVNARRRQLMRLG